MNKNMLKKIIILIITTIIALVIYVIGMFSKRIVLVNISLIMFIIEFIVCLYKLIRKCRGKIIIDTSKRTLKHKKIKKVSVVIPNYNYANYIENRIDCVLEQTYPIYELIVLDDCSNDNSIEIINNKIKEVKKKYKNVVIKFIPNKENSGNVFKQWGKAFKESTGDYLWIAEADDLCDKHFLNVAMQGFDNPDVVLSYTESKGIDENGNVFRANFRDWEDPFNIKLWNKSFNLDGIEYLNKSLCLNDSIVNASGVVFKKKESIPVSEYLKGSQSFRLSGDWYFYSKYLLHGSISFSTDPLNYHRIHSNSVTSTTSDKLKIEEMIRIQDEIIKNVKLTPLAKYNIKKIRKYSK